MKKIKYLFATLLLISCCPAFSQSEEPDTAFAQSEKLESNHNYKAAIDIMNKVYDKSSYEINLRLGWLNYLDGQNTVAETFYKKAIDLVPNAIEPRLGCTSVLEALGDANEMIEQYNKILAINPQNSYANYWIGMIYYDKKDYQTALPYFENVLNLYPFDYSSLLMAGLTEYQLGKQPEAKVLLDKVLCISLNDKSAGEVLAKISDASGVPGSNVSELPGIFSRSEGFETNKDYKTAIDIMKKAYDSTSYEINLRLGWLNYENGENRTAEFYYKKAIGLKPASIEARLGYTYVANTLEDVNALMQQYTMILQLDPQNSYANYWLGMIYYNKKDYKSAEPYFEKVENLYPFNYDGLNMSAWTKYKLGKKAEAKALFVKVLCISSGDSSAQYGLRLIGESQ